MSLTVEVSYMSTQCTNRNLDSNDGYFLYTYITYKNIYNNYFSC